MLGLVFYVGAMSAGGGGGGVHIGVHPTGSLVWTCAEPASLCHHGLPQVLAACHCQQQAPPKQHRAPCTPAAPAAWQSMRLGARYDTLSAELTTTAQTRDPASRKCTMPSPHANHNLRHVTGLTAQHAQQQAQQQAQEAAEAGLAAASSPPAAAAEAISTAPAAVRPAPAGGTLRVSLQLSGLSKGWCASEGIAPEMTITLGGQALHAPLIERTIELPMDIHEGRVSGLYCLGTKQGFFPALRGMSRIQYCSCADLAGTFAAL